MTIKVGDLLPFFAPFNASYPKREQGGVVSAVNEDGTVDITAEDGTPHAGVPLIEAGEPHEGNGPFALKPTQAAVEEFREESGEQEEKPE